MVLGLEKNGLQEKAYWLLQALSKPTAFKIYKTNFFRIASFFVLPLFGLKEGDFGDLAELFVLERCPRICARPFFLQQSAEFSFCKHSRDKETEAISLLVISGPVFPVGTVFP